MALYAVEIALAEAFALGVIAVGLQGDELIDERGKGRLREWIARRDIDLFDLFGQCVDDALQQVLVAEHNGRVATVGDAVFPLFEQPLTDESSLCGVGFCRDIGDVFRLSEMVVDFLVFVVEFVRKFVEILTNEMATFVVVFHIIIVEIPVETGATLSLEAFEEFLFDFLQHIEAHENVGIVLEINLVEFRHLPIQTTFVSQTLLFESGVERSVNLVEFIPNRQEFLLELAFGLFGLEIGEKLGEKLLLLVGKIGRVVEFVYVAKVGEDAARVGEVFVDVVEVGKQQLSPREELVERFVLARDGGENAVEVADEFHRIGHFERAVVAKQVADGDVRRAPDGLVGESGEVVVEEERRTLVGENDSDFRKLGAELADEVFGDVSEKTIFH